MPVKPLSEWDGELMAKLDAAVEAAKTDDEYTAAMKAIADYKEQFLPALPNHAMSEDLGDDGTDGQPTG